MYGNEAAEDLFPASFTEKPGASGFSKKEEG